MNVLTIIEAVARFFASHPVIFGVTTAWGLVLAIKSALKARSTVDRVGNYLGVALQAAF